MRAFAARALIISFYRRCQLLVHFTRMEVTIISCFADMKPIIRLLSFHNQASPLALCIFAISNQAAIFRCRLPSARLEYFLTDKIIS